MANITRFDPLGEMVSLRSAMDRLLRITAGGAEVSENGTKATS
jgi:hypothetical protein